MVVDPWGRVLVDLGGEEGKDGGVGVEVVDIDLDLIEKAREQIHLERRVDVYPEIK
jgi:predicted amidohydrolase